MRGAGGAFGADDLAAAVRRCRRTSSARPTIRTRPRSCWPKPAIPNGFNVTMDCPNDRYVNDEAICQAVVAMLAQDQRQGQSELRSRRRNTSPRCWSSGGYDTSFYLLGWTPGSFDSWNVLANMYRCRDEKGNGGTFNLGGYCNPKVDELTKQVLVETDTAKRDQLIKQAYQIGQVQDVGLHPAAPAGAGLGRVEQHESACSAPTTRSVLLVQKGIAMIGVIRARAARIDAASAGADSKVRHARLRRSSLAAGRRLSCWWSR